MSRVKRQLARGLNALRRTNECCECGWLIEQELRDENKHVCWECYGRQTLTLPFPLNVIERATDVLTFFNRGSGTVEIYCLA